MSRRRGYDDWSIFPPYVTVAERQARARKQSAALAKKGKALSPVVLEGTKIARSFWGQAWCRNLEAYSDYSNRLPRGRSYARNGLVVDLQIGPGRVTALVSGSSLYHINIAIQPLPKKTWQLIRRRCAGHIGSLIELLQGRLSGEVMEIVTRHGEGLFPSPKEIRMDCNCPDWAGLCKHLAAVLYGIGARLDEQPELLFTLRKVDALELIAETEAVEALTQSTTDQKTIADEDLSAIFGIELDGPSALPPSVPASPAGRKAKPKLVEKAAKAGARAKSQPAADAPPSTGTKRKVTTRRTSTASSRSKTTQNSEPAKRAKKKVTKTSGSASARRKAVKRKASARKS